MRVVHALCLLCYAWLSHVYENVCVPPKMNVDTHEIPSRVPVLVAADDRLCNARRVRRRPSWRGAMPNMSCCLTRTPTGLSRILAMISIRSNGIFAGQPGVARHRHDRHTLLCALGVSPVSQSRTLYSSSTLFSSFCLLYMV